MSLSGAGFLRARPDAPRTPDLKVERGAFRTLARAFAFSASFLLAFKTIFGDVTSVASGSMAPTIFGDDTEGDAIVLDRTAYWFSEPKRWELVFFTYANNRATTFLKRLVGLPGEQVAIYDGDLWLVDPDCFAPIHEAILEGRARRAERSDASTRSAFLSRPLLPESAVGAFDESALDRYFSIAPDRRDAFKNTAEGGVRCLVGAAAAAAEAEFREFATDRPPGAPGEARVRIGGADGAESVSDVGVSCDVLLEPESEAYLFLRCPRGGGAYRATLRSDANGGELVLSGGAEGGDRRVATPSIVGRAAKLRLERLDGEVAAFLDDVRLASAPCPPPPPLREPERDAPTPEKAADGARVGFGVVRGGATFRTPRVDRDVHYAAVDQSRFLVPEGSYLFLGDRPGDSADARRWRVVLVEDETTGRILEGDADGIRPNALLNDGRNPKRDEKGRDVFVDRENREHVLPKNGAWRVLGAYRTPYVRREDLIGRASMIAWPPSRVGPPR